MAKGSIKIARRYARSLAELYPVAELDNLQSCLMQIANIWKTNEELRNSLSNPAFKSSDKIAVAREIASKVKANDEKFANFLSLLCESKRILEIEQITEAFNSIVYEIKKILELKIFSAFDISENEKDSFKNHIQKEFGTLATIEWQIDKSLIGGLRVKSGDKLYDSSLQGALKRLEESLLQQ